MSAIAAIILAGGTGQRIGGEVPKTYRLLNGQPVLSYSLSTFQQHPEIGTIVVVYHPDHEAHITPFKLEYPDMLWVTGGAERQDSVRNGLEALVPFAKHKSRNMNHEGGQQADPAMSPRERRAIGGPAGPIGAQTNNKILIHDAARPYVSPELISRMVAAEAKAAVPVLPVTDTIKHRDGHTLDRGELFAAQTPQAFDFEMILNFHRRNTDTVTDDAMLAEKAGIAVTLIEGDRRNRKLTTEEDFNMMETQKPSFLRKQDSSLGNPEIPASAGMSRIAVGNGYDVHAFVPHSGDDTTIKICGLSVECDMAIEGHSDGDVGLHALTDAILGAIGHGDIGEHFSSENPEWKGADSELFLKEAMRLMREAGSTLSHCDITLIAQMPKLSPHRQAMRQRVAGICGVDVSQVSVKATTTDHLGFIGRKEGLAALATATVVRF